MSRTELDVKRSAKAGYWKVKINLDGHSIVLGKVKARTRKIAMVRGHNMAARHLGKNIQPTVNSR